MIAHLFKLIDLNKLLTLLLDTLILFVSMSCKQLIWTINLNYSDLTYTLNEITHSLVVLFRFAIHSKLRFETFRFETFRFEIDTKRDIQCSKFRFEIDTKRDIQCSKLRFETLRFETFRFGTHTSSSSSYVFI